MPAMNFTRKLDRAVQWAGEKMGQESRTNVSDDFKMLETEMALRSDGMDRLHRSMTTYVKWLNRRTEGHEDKEKGLPTQLLGRIMAGHGDDFEPDSEFGACLATLGRTNEQLASIQESYANAATDVWLESLERNLAMMKDYHTARKKLESRRLGYEASMTKLQKARRDDFRVEEETRTNKAKYEEANEDILRRMQDIKDAESDTVRDLTSFLDAQLDYHERCAEELRRARHNWPAAGVADVSSPDRGYSRRPGSEGGRSITAPTLPTRIARTNSYNAYENEPQPEPVRLPLRSNSRLSTHVSDFAVRPPVARANTFQHGTTPAPRGPGSSTPACGVQHAANIGTARSGLRPISRIQTHNANIFADDGDDTASGSSSPRSADRSASPATSFGSMSRSTTSLGAGTGTRKAPPPPPPSRSKKPPPPVPAKREAAY